MIEKIEHRLGSWKMPYLPKGGRVASTLSNLPTYFLFLFLVLTNVAVWIEKLCHDFLWNDTRDDFKFYMVKWDKIRSPMSFGDLRIRNLKIFNRTILKK